MAGPRRSSRNHSTVAQQPLPQRLRPATPEDLEAAWSDQESDSTLSEPQPQDLEEPWLYHFQTGDAVWIRTAGGNWHHGKVSGQKTRKGQTRSKEGLFYPVVFNDKIRKYFAPLNGEIKPDSAHVRQLLKDAGYLE